jgi:hypothetical protein
MAKRIECPECGYRVRIPKKNIKTIGIRSKRRGQGFDYEMTVPEDITEDGRVTTTSNDATLISLFSLYAGVMGAGITSAFLPNHLHYNTVTLITAQVGTITMAAAGFLGYGYLCAESNQRLKRILPFFYKQKKNWAMGQQLAESTGAVTLTIDTRNEYDGFTSRYFGPLPVEVKRFNLWATAAIEGNSLAINKWTGGGKEFDRYTEYQPLLEMMLNAGVLVKSGKGNVLTHTGKRTLRQHLKAYPPPPFHERV